VDDEIKARLRDAGRDYTVRDRVRVRVRIRDIECPVDDDIKARLRDAGRD
jgi:hypothetical protein